MSESEIVKIVVQLGALGVLFAMGFGAYRLVDKWAPALVAAVKEQAAELRALGAKIDGFGAQLSELRGRTSEVAEQLAEDRGAAVATGQHAAVPSERATLLARRPGGHP